jgi:hypothetical protein
MYNWLYSQVMSYTKPAKNVEVTCKQWKLFVVFYAFFFSWLILVKIRFCSFVRYKYKHNLLGPLDCYPLATKCWLVKYRTAACSVDGKSAVIASELC